MKNEGIWSWVVKVNVYVSAFICALRIRNKTLHIIVELLYGLIILFLPVLFVSFYVVSFGAGEAVDFWSVTKYVAYIGYGIYVCVLLSNKKQDKKVEDYILIGSLYLIVYMNDTQGRKKRTYKVIAELLCFGLLTIVLWLGIVGLLESLKRMSEEMVLIGGVMAFVLSYIVFVYGIIDKEKRKRRKSVLGILLFLVWIIFVGIRIKDYWQQKSDIGLLDMVILFFSAIFTIPTLYGWVSWISKRLVEPYGEYVQNMKTSLVDEYMVRFSEWKNKGGLFLESTRRVKEKLICRWKEDKWSRKIVKVLCIPAIVVGMIFVFWASEKASDLLGVAESEVKNWYASLEFGVKGIVDKILMLMLLLGVMIYIVIKSPSVYKSKNTIKDKISCILGLILVEVVFGFGVYSVLF